MEYLVLAGALIILVVLIMAKEYWNNLQYRKCVLAKLYENYGSIPEREYTEAELNHIKSYYLRHQSREQIDDITWNDLNMDRIYERINSSVSSAGDEYLYYLLRTPSYEPEALNKLETMITWFMEHKDKREIVQKQLYLLGRTGKHSIHEYIDNLSILGSRSNKKYVLFDIAFILSIGIMFYSLPVGIVILLLIACHNIIGYFSEFKEIEPYITSFAYVRRLLFCTEQLLKTDIDCNQEDIKLLKNSYRKLQSFQMQSGFVSSGLSLGGDPLSIIRDYLKMLFYLDLILFNRSYAELMKHIEDIDIILTVTGKLESAIVIGSYRHSLDYYCIPDFIKMDGHTDSVRSHTLTMEEGYHPLLKDAVSNSVQTDKCVLITGSNASGKSTFLRAVAVNAITAQTIHTCCAEKYCAPMYHIYSSMSLKDDIANGDSYYMAEIKSIKRILDHAKYYTARNEHVLCFVDEVLRGTNTVERIAASSQILKLFANMKVQCFAATHDVELTELLKEQFANYHFHEKIENDDITFPYKILSGPATSRNAIALLRLLHYDTAITKEADILADHFLKTGKWS